MPRIELDHHFAVPLARGFDYITAPGNWPEYWPGLIRLDPGSRWREPGDRARLTLRLLGRPVELDMTLRRFEPRRLVEYTSVQRGLPDARHERHFTASGDGFDFRIIVELDGRPGLRGVLDRIVVRRATARVLRQTVANLERRFASG